MLVEYENSDSESEEDNPAKAAGSDEAKSAEYKDTTEADSVAISDEEDDANRQENPDNDEDDKHNEFNSGSGLTALAAADDTVEESLRNRLPASAPRPPSPPKSTTSAASSATAAAKQNDLKQKQLLLQQKRRRLLMLEPNNGAAKDINDDDDEDDEDAAKRRRIATAGAIGPIRGATSLLARLPKPKALAVREGGSRLFVPKQRQVQQPLPDPMPPRQTEDMVDDHPSASTSSYRPAFVESDFNILPPSELHRYRQATGASLTADIAEGGAGGGIIDIRQADQIAGADLELTKQLTRNAGEDLRRKPDGPEPSSLAKRKHQITYLAYQAKERELELKNSWSDARFSQRSSQRKYGF